MRENRPDWRTDLMNRLRPITKALAALGASFVVAAAAYASDGTLSATDVLIALASALATSGVVYAVPKNKEPTGRHEATGPAAE
jgi:hypothetical protein